MSAVAERGTEEKDSFSGPSQSRRTKDHRLFQRKEVIIVMRKCLKKEEEIDNLRPSEEERRKQKVMRARLRQQHGKFLYYGKIMNDGPKVNNRLQCLPLGPAYALVACDGRDVSASSGPFALMASARPRAIS